MRFTDFERLGVSVAAMSDRSDGDCRRSEPGRDSSCAAFCIALGIPPNHLVRASQVHGTTVARATVDDRGRGVVPEMAPFPGTDAIITNVPGLPIGVTVADCVPLWLFDPVTRSAGIVHAGRVGTFDNVVGATVEALGIAYGVDAANLHVLVGPSAGPEAYEVSDEIADEFEMAGLPLQGRYLDLWQANAMRLAEVGVSAEHISISGICTITDGRFHSHRAHANGMRNLAVLVI